MYFEFCVSSCRMCLHKCTLNIVAQCGQDRNPKDDVQFCRHACRTVASPSLLGKVQVGSLLNLLQVTIADKQLETRQ